MRKVISFLFLFGFSTMVQAEKSVAIKTAWGEKLNGQNEMSLSKALADKTLLDTGEGCHDHW